MIPVSRWVRVWLETGVEDMRRGMSTLAFQVQKDLGYNPHEGDFFVFHCQMSLNIDPPFTEPEPRIGTLNTGCEAGAFRTALRHINRNPF